MSYTYTELKTSIKDYTDNQEATFVSHLDRYILSAEERIFKNVDLEYFRKNVTGSTTSGNEFLAVPLDYLSSFSLSVTNNSAKEFLQQRDVNFIQEYNPNPATTGVPRYYALYDVSNFILAPTPNANFDVELHYYYRPESLTNSKIEITVNNVTGAFQANEKITGGTSAEVSTITTLTTATQFTIIVPTGDFVVGETITGGTSGATGVIATIGEDTTKTWLSTNAPNTMLYGCLVEAYTFMKGEADLITLYQNRFVESLSRLKNYGEAMENTDTYRDGLVRANRT